MQPRLPFKFVLPPRQSQHSSPYSPSLYRFLSPALRPPYVPNDSSLEMPCEKNHSLPRWYVGVFFLPSTFSLTSVTCANLLSPRDTCCSHALSFPHSDTFQNFTLRFSFLDRIHLAPSPREAQKTSPTATGYLFFFTPSVRPADFSLLMDPWTRCLKGPRESSDPPGFFPPSVVSRGSSAQGTFRYFFPDMFLSFFPHRQGDFVACSRSAAKNVLDFTRLSKTFPLGPVFFRTSVQRFSDSLPGDPNGSALESSSFIAAHGPS